MRGLIILKFLGGLTAVIGVCMLFPLAWAVWDGSPDQRSFIMSLCISFAASGALLFIGRKGHASDMGVREAFAAVTFSWVAASVVGALPFYIHGTVPTFTDAFFETMSGFSTTGSSVLTDIESNPRGILFWRSLTHWLGGMGIIVLTLAVMPALGIGGMQLFKAEVPGPVPEKLTPRVQQTALYLWGIYVLLSVLQTVLLMLGGLNLFDALTHMFGTMATGGFSTYNDSVGHFTPYVQWIIIIFMFLAGANFSLHYAVLTGKWRAMPRDSEFRFYCGITAVCTIILIASVYRMYPTAEETARVSAFQAISILTTTGFATADYLMWPYVAQFMLLCLMFVGGCAGSTGGAMKNVRLLVLVRHVTSEIRRVIHPRAVIPVRMGEHTLETKFVMSVGAFFALYMGILVIATMAVCATGVDVLTALSGTAATLGNIGPGLGGVGPASNFAAIPPAAKWIYTLCMLMGRLELFTVVVLFHPSCWKF